MPRRRNLYLATVRTAPRGGRVRARVGRVRGDGEVAVGVGLCELQPPHPQTPSAEAGGRRCEEGRRDAQEGRRHAHASELRAPAAAAQTVPLMPV